jgi:hypothetical protein
VDDARHLELHQAGANGQICSLLSSSITAPGAAPAGYFE